MDLKYTILLIYFILLVRTTAATDCECVELDHISVSCTGCAELSTNVNYPIDPDFIEMVNFSRNIVQEISDVPCTSLTSLDVSFNIISNIKDQVFHDCAWLRHLNISNNKLENITMADFFGLNSVIELDLSYNSLKMISDQGVLDDMRMDLQILNLSNNQIQWFNKKALSNLRKLRRLDLSENDIRDTIDIHTEGLTSLEYLDLSHNSLTSIHPDAFSDMSKLTNLDLSNNKLEVLEADAFYGLGRNLTVLNLAHNHIKSIGELFKGLYELKELNLNNNPVAQLLPSALPQSLEILSLVHGSLDEIPAEAFLGCRNLKRVIIRGNIRLASVNRYAFDRSLSKVDTVDFNNSMLETLSADTLNWDDIKNVDLYGANWRCDCDVKWIQRTLPQTAQMMICKTPAIHEGKTLDKVQFEEEECRPAATTSHYFAYVLLTLTVLTVLSVVVGVLLMKKIRKSGGGFRYKNLNEAGSVQYEARGESLLTS